MKLCFQMKVRLISVKIRITTVTAFFSNLPQTWREGYNSIFVGSCKRLMPSASCMA